MKISYPKISISIVSHGQKDLIIPLLDDLESIYCEDFEVLLTLNVAENEDRLRGRSFPIRIIRNGHPLGFGANHNNAAYLALGTYFAVVNPDIRIKEFCWNTFLLPFDSEDVGVISPLVLSKDGEIEDSARPFPTILNLLRRIFYKEKIASYYETGSSIEVDWVGGMFMVFRLDMFRKISGFDQKRFFMYMEDVDICRRLWSQGGKVIFNKNVYVTHYAQRKSHRNLNHFRWHLTSIFRYFTGL